VSLFVAAQLKPLESYLAYGYVSVKTVEELVHRRSYITIGGVKKPLSDNITVEQLLGDKNIICLNDLSHEIYSVGPHFEDSVKILEPFHLSSPMGVFEKKTLKTHAQEKGYMSSDKMEEFMTKIL
jgi:large subunit ribosomal protein L7e